MPVSTSEMYRSWMKAGGRCECREHCHDHDGVRCNRPLLWQNMGVDAPGRWEIGIDEGKNPSKFNRCVILCHDCSDKAEKHEK